MKGQLALGQAIQLVLVRLTL